jgi:L-alanine-DL-glutamate epimerase-like enolase superfamily enzyme
MPPQARIESVAARAYTVPTDKPEADGTLSWDKTTIAVVHVSAGGVRGIGYTYADPSVVGVIGGTLERAVRGRDAMDVPGCFAAMQREVRNLGRSGLAQNAIAAVDAALWDAKAKLLELPLAALLGTVRDAVPIYGSGGFTSYDDATLCAQLANWVERDGCRWVKMKIGSDPDRDPARVRAAHGAIGTAALFVDANGAYPLKRALALAERFAEHDVRWFEEPVSSDDLASLRLLRERAPATMEIAAGEYCYTLDDIRRMLEAQAVDVQQADATRCGGITGFMAAGVLCAAHHRDLSAHCAPAIHLHVACAVPRLRHLEWFHDHVRIEHMLFDGAPVPRDGAIRPDPARPGLGIALKRQDAERYATD